MSDVPVEAAAPDPVTTTPAVENPIQTETSSEAVTTNADVAMAEPEKPLAGGEAKEENATGSSKAGEVSAEKPEEAKPRQNGRDNPRNGNNRGPPRNNYHKPQNLSKYDPSTLPTTSDHGKIRKQVSCTICVNSIILLGL
jgi:hypothetical protein